MHHQDLIHVFSLSHPEADLDGLSLFKAKVQFRSCALIGFLFGQFTFLFHPPETQKRDKLKLNNLTSVSWSFFSFTV